MESLLNSEEAVEYIENFTWSKTRLGLGRTRELLSKLGDPQNKLKFVHVAGSNGKGSVCAMVESILRSAGYRVGLYTSPYLQSFYEQLKIDGESISPEELLEIVNIVAPVAEEMEDHPSRFEILTAVAMLYFHKNDCDIVVLEVGMGGELDSTNVIPPAEVSIITNIGLDHTEFLGETIGEIAKTKAGIIKRGSSVVAYDSGAEAIEVIRDKCLLENCELTVVDFSGIKTHEMTIKGQRLEIPGFPEVFLPLVGIHQRNNAAVALSAIEVLRKRGFSISDNCVCEGMSKVKWPARFEILLNSPLFILDGGHNPQCAGALADSLSCLYPDKKYLFLMGILEDKDVDEILRITLPLASEIIAVTPDSPRAMQAEDLAEKIAKIEPNVSVTTYSVKEGLESAIFKGILEKKDIVCFGSLYLAGDIENLFVEAGKRAQRKVCNLRRLNMSDEERKKESTFICKRLTENPDIIKAKTIFSYKSMPEELDLSEFDKWARENGKHVAYPVTDMNGNMDFWEPCDDSCFVQGTYGILEPDPMDSRICSIEEADVILMPCVGFDKDGRRIGHGAGYYDNYLSDDDENKLIIVGFSTQLLDEVITDQYDKKGKVILK